jgi:hypothetical protein
LKSDELHHPLAVAIIALPPPFALIGHLLNSSSSTGISEQVIACIWRSLLPCEMSEVRHLAGQKHWRFENVVKTSPAIGAVLVPLRHRGVVVSVDALPQAREPI